MYKCVVFGEHFFRLGFKAGPLTNKFSFFKLSSVTEIEEIAEGYESRG